LSTLSTRTGLSAQASNGLPAVPGPVFQIPSTFAGQYLNNASIAFGLAAPFVQQWNLSVQNAIKGNVVEIRYLANKGTKLYRGIDFNGRGYHCRGIPSEPPEGV
jgi:hypothetical protein